MTDDALPTFQQPPAEPALRASDADRAEAEQVLRKAERDGRLTAAELDERLELAQGARNKSELTILTADLVPVQDSHHADDLVPLSRPGNVVATVYSSNDVTSVLSTRTRRGVWSVPAKLSVIGFMGTVKLDLREAVFESYDVTIDNTLIMTELQLWVPAGVDVVDETTMVLSDTNFKKMAPAQAGLPRITLQGNQFMSSIVVRSSDDPSLMDRIKGKF